MVMMLTKTAAKTTQILEGKYYVDNTGENHSSRFQSPWISLFRPHSHLLNGLQMNPKFCLAAEEVFEVR
jgi:hypothetical protein